MSGGIGIILNPRAGRDIRRLVAHAAMVSGPEKMLKVRRIIAGAQAFGEMPVYMVADSEGLAQRLGQDVAGVHVVSASSATLGGWNGAEATAEAVHRLEDLGVDLLVVIGGDGTQRQVAKAAPSLPVLPLAGGTNNVACWVGEDTVAGMAAAAVVREGPPPRRAGKILRVETESGARDLALVDVAWTSAPFVGALAVWDPSLVSRLVLGVADPVRPGLSNVGGQVAPLAEGDDAVLDLVVDAAGSPVPTVLAPGLLTTMFVASHRRLALHTVVPGTWPHAFTVALDGERSLTCRGGELVRVWGERTGPQWLSPTEILQQSGPRA